MGRYTGMFIFSVIVSSVGSGFIHGYTIGSLSQIEDIVRKFIVDTFQNRDGKPPKESVVTLLWAVIGSIYCIGGIVGGFLVELFSENLGRRKSLMANTIILFVGAALMGIAKFVKTFELLILGRFILGINNGLNGGICPMYLSEISPDNIRGAIGSLYQLNITISILVAQILTFHLCLGTEALWPIAFWLMFIPAILQLVGFIFCPESPKFLLIKKNDAEKAEKSLKSLRKEEDVSAEMNEFKAAATKAESEPPVTWKEMFKQKKYRSPLLLVIVMNLAQQFSGINAIMFYVGSIFKAAKLNQTTSGLGTISIGLVNVIMTVISVFLVEIAGRKTLLVFGFSGCIIFNVCVMISLMFLAAADVVKYLTILFINLFIISFASGPGSIPWLIFSEMLDQSGRPKGASACVISNLLANFLVALAFPPLQEFMKAWVFLIFVVLTALCLLYLVFKLPETKEKPIEEIIAGFEN